MWGSEGYCVQSGWKESGCASVWCLSLLPGLDQSETELCPDYVQVSTELVAEVKAL